MHGAAGTARASQGGSDEAFGAWVRVLFAVPDVWRWLLTVVDGRFRHKLGSEEIVEGEHWVKVKPVEDEAWLEEALRDQHLL